MLVRNLRYAVRSLARAPGFTLTVVLTLAIGIGANSAVFSALNAILLRPLPLPDADRLVVLGQDRERVALSNVAPIRLEDWNERNSTFEALTGSYDESISDTSGDLPEKITQANVAPRFVDVWGVAPMLGRGFVRADHQPGATPAVMISERYWQRRFKSDPAVVGTTMTLGTRSYNLVGVMPASFTLPDRDVDVWAALIYLPYTQNRQSAWFRSFGRLKPGVTLSQAQADLEVVQAALASEFPVNDARLKPEVRSFKETIVGGVRGSLWLLFAAVSVLLLIACTNIASLLLSRAAQREQEIAVRFSLGSSRWAVASQVLAEAGVLAFVGAALGLAVASAASAALRSYAAGFPRVDELAVDVPLLAWTAISVVVVTLLCGVAPALRSTRGRLAHGGRAQVSTRHAAQWLFVGVQVTLSVLLLAGAGLLLRSFQELGRVNPGFDPEHVLTFRISGSYGDVRAQMAQDIEVLLDELAGVPGVKGGATSSPVPGVLNDRSGFEFGSVEYTLNEGRDDDKPMRTEMRIVSSSYFATMRIPVIAGNVCRRQQPDATQEVVVNQSFARRYLGGRAPLGLTMAGGGGLSRIVGVVGDARDFGLDREPTSTVYFCTTAVAYPPLAFLVRTDGDPMSVIGAIRQRLKAIAPQHSVYDVLPLEQRIGAEYAQERLRTALLVMFAGAALSLVCLGIYGTLSYIVSLRRREVGLRVALGALSGAIVAQFVGKALRVVVIGGVAGLVLAVAFGRALSGMLYGVSPFDPATLLAVAVLVPTVAALAAFLPALRASRIDPMEALRYE
jgi:putative ABC transport system permease protein